MKVTRLGLHDFRNYGRLVLDFDDGVHIFVGENAQGKTNLLESLYLLATGRSYRTSKEEDLIRWGQPTASISACIQRETGSSANLVVRYKVDGPRHIEVDGQTLLRLADLFGTVTAVLFSPEDLNLVKGGPQERRRFLDLALAQVSPSYRAHLLQFHKILRQRNAVLKLAQERRLSPGELDVWDGQISVAGARVMAKRFLALRELSSRCAEAQQEITGGRETMFLSYEPGVASDLRSNAQEIVANVREGGLGISSLTDAFAELISRSLALRRQAEIARGQTLVGPQRDDVALFVNQVDLRVFGSQGQQRTGALACKLAELSWMKAESGEYPLLLLDDVMSELDAERRRRLVACIPPEVQLFVTTTSLHSFDESVRNGACMIEVQQGEASRLSTS